EPGMELEEGVEIGDTPVEEMAIFERQRAGREQEDDNEDVSERRREIGGELALEDEPELSHAVAALARTVSCVVMARNTSSRRPASAKSSRTSHFSLTTRALTSSMRSAWLLGKAVMRTKPSSRPICSTLATAGSVLILAEAAAACSAGSASVTAL